MTARRDPLDRLLEAIVAVPVSLAVATRRLIPVATTRIERRVARDLAIIKQAGRRSTVASPAWDVTDEDDELPADWEPALPVTREDVAGQDVAGLDVDPGALPIEEYDHLSARQIVDRLAPLTGDELALVAAYERAHRRRQTVLSRIAQLA
jgi:hypothetical protein